MNTPVPGPRASRPGAADASAVPTITGLRSWGAVLVAVLLTAIGAAIDGSVNGELSWGFRIGFVLGVALAAVLVRRASIFTAMVQPPLVMVVLIFVALRLLASESMKITAIKVITAFPTMLTGTVLALLLCVLRIFAQPMRRPQEASKAQSVSVHV